MARGGRIVECREHSSRNKFTVKVVVPDDTASEGEISLTFVFDPILGSLPPSNAISVLLDCQSQLHEHQCSPYRHVSAEQYPQIDEKREAVRPAQGRSCAGGPKCAQQFSACVCITLMRSLLTQCGWLRSSCVYLMFCFSILF